MISSGSPDDSCHDEDSDAQAPHIALPDDALFHHDEEEIVWETACLKIEDAEPLLHSPDGICVQRKNDQAQEKSCDPWVYRYADTLDAGAQRMPQIPPVLGSMLRRTPAVVGLMSGPLQLEVVVLDEGVSRLTQLTARFWCYFLLECEMPAE